MLVMMRSLSYGQQVQTAMGALSNSLPYIDVLDETMERYSRQRAPGGDRVIDVVGPVTARHVSFAYDRGIDVLVLGIYSQESETAYIVEEAHRRGIKTVGFMVPTGRGVDPIRGPAVPLRPADARGSG